MRFRRAGIAATLAACAACAATATPTRVSAQAPADSAAQAPPDSVAQAPPDSVAQARRDSFALVQPGGAAPDTSRARIDLVRERTQGAASLEEILRLRRATFLQSLPIYGPPQGTLLLADGGGPIHPASHRQESDGSTDRTAMGSTTLSWGVPDLAAALDDSRGTGLEVLDLDALDFPLERSAFQGPEEALTTPASLGPAYDTRNAPKNANQEARSTLFYRNGDGGDLATGARFLLPAWGRSFYGSYTRLQGGGLDPLRDSESIHYTLQADLPRFLSRDFTLGWRQLKREITDWSGGRAEWERRQLSLRASRQGATMSEFWAVRLSDSKRTQIAPDASRERWSLPEALLTGTTEWRHSASLTWIASGEVLSQRVSYRIGALPEFDPRREAARIHIGVRHPTGARSGVGADAAYDARETEPSLWDARVSVWCETTKFEGRLDVESAHERPTWIDRLTPPRTLFQSFDDPSLAYVQFLRSGDASLGARTLQGSVASATYAPGRGFSLEPSASLHRVTNDFGWDLSREVRGDTLFIEDLARVRGSGWVSHASLGWNLRWRALLGRGVGWIRGGPDALSPRGSSPPRRALDAGVAARRALFQGDLDLRLGMEAHARGARHGTIEEPAQVTWDATINGEIGESSIFFRFDDVFDRTVGSGVFTPDRISGSPLPGRSFRMGVVWNLAD